MVPKMVETEGIIEEFDILEEKLGYSTVEMELSNEMFRERVKVPVDEDVIDDLEEGKKVEVWGNMQQIAPDNNRQHPVWLGVRFKD